ncbi:MAG: hypothetical protein EGP82_10770 [Odoribacter splanchnicus]|nr:hypothetical protein [Odoribacter splanchnicus]
MGWNPNFYIVFPYSLAYQINWPEGWGYQCVANLPLMLKEVLNVSTIGSEIKLIWNEDHRDTMIKKNEITYEQLDDYLKSDCSMLSFLSEGTMKRAVKALKRMGAVNFVCVSSYRDVILQQAYYRHNKNFNL